MRPRLLRLAFAATLCGALPALSADAPKPAQPVHSDLWQAAMGALTELQAADDPHLPVPARVKRLAAYRYSPDLAARVRKVFGTEQPVTFTQLPPVHGQLAWRAALVPLHYVGPDGMSADWSELAAQVAVDKAGRNMTMHGSWPSLDLHDKDVHIAMRDAALTGKQRLGYAGIWFGDAEVTIGRLTAGPSGGMPGAAFDGIRITTAYIEHPRTAELRYAIGTKAITVADERVDDFRMALRVTNVDKRALGALKAATDKAGLAKLPPEQRLDAMKPMFKDLARAVVTRGAAIEIDDISAGYQGYRASIKGRVSVEGASRADLGALAALAGKIVARFDVKVPVALVRAVASRVAEKQQAANGGDQQSAAQVGQTMTDVIVGKLLNAGYARLENDVLVSTIEWRGGKLRANGKEVDLPKPQHPPAQVAGGAFLQARRVADSCKLPDYPEDVVREDRALELTLRFTVGTDGHLRNLAVASPSKSPAWDQAALAAAAGCTYIPALSNGKPVEVPMTWTVAREPGSARP